MKITTALLSALMILQYSCSKPEQIRISSPDSKISFSLAVDSILSYTISYNSELLIDTSSISFEFENEPLLGIGLEVLSVKEQSFNGYWYPVLKRFDSIQNHYNELIVGLKESDFPNRRINLEIRAYNDGVAFRVHFLTPDTTLQYTIMDEDTEFNFPKDVLCWAVDYQGFDTHQESEFRKMKVSEITSEMITGLPLTVKFNENLYGAITEAALIDYAGMYLTPMESGGRIGLKTQLAPRHGKEREGEKVLFKGEHKTPWRVIMLGETPGKLIESEIIQNLNEPCMIEDPSWIQPGISAWDHWWSGEVKMEQSVIFEYIDLASEMGWKYMLIDWQWYGQFDQPESDITKVAPQLNMSEILEYAKSKNVHCWVWLYWTDVNKADFDAACKLYHDWGLAGVKIDFMARDDQEMVNWYHDVVKTAAKHQLMVDFHGAYKPTGWRRTYPNLVTREGVMGNEYNKWSDRVTPEHDCTLPFTRMLAGPMDYTPGGFLNSNPEEFRTGVPARVQGTRAHELAKFVVFDSPFMVACDHPKHYRGETGSEFLKKVPSVWDDTRVLQGEIGEYILTARRSGDTWFIGAMTNSVSRDIEVDLNFLKAGQNYEMVSFYDTDATLIKATSVEERKSRVEPGDKLKLSMKPGGGYAAYLMPEEK